MATILYWTQPDGPYVKRGDGKIEISGSENIITRNMKPKGYGTKIAGYAGKSGKDFNFNWGIFAFRATKYWGLVHDANKVNWTKVQLWEYADIMQGGDFVGMPQRDIGLPFNGYCNFAAYFLGDYVSADMIKYGAQAGPVFRIYAQRGSNYYKILDGTKPADDYSKFKDSPIIGGRGLNPGNPGPGVPPTQGQLPSGPISSIGPDSQITGTDPPANPLYAGWPTFYPGMIFPKPVEKDTNPNTNKPNNKDKGKGQWVTGPDGKPYYLPPGIDFAGLQREYDRTHPKPETKIVVRMPRGYLAPVPTKDTKPRMTQRFTQDPSKIVDRAFNKDRDFTVTETFMFPYIPQNIRYSDIGSQWQEIPRALNTSFVDWVGYKLMKVSMDFLVTEKMQVGPITTPNVVSDGLFNSVGARLDTLRRMATNKHPVTLEGLDDILSVQMARSQSGSGRGLEFVIQDLNITAGRRTVDIDTGLATNPSRIAAAQVSLTLQEIPIETVTIVKLPPLNLGTPLIGKKDGGGGGVPTLGLQSDLLTGLKWAVG